jgi:hypothetical protein
MTETDQNPKPGGPRRPIPRRAYSPLWFAAGLLLLMLLASGIRTVFSQGEELQYSQFKTLVAEGRVSQITITADRIEHAELTRPSWFTTVQVGTRNCSSLLESKNVAYRRCRQPVADGTAVVILPRCQSGCSSTSGTGIVVWPQSRQDLFEDDVKSRRRLASMKQPMSTRIVDFLKNPVLTLGPIPRGCCWSARRGPARPCWPAPWPARPRCPFSA